MDSIAQKANCTLLTYKEAVLNYDTALINLKAIVDINLRLLPYYIYTSIDLPILNLTRRFDNVRRRPNINSNSIESTTTTTTNPNRRTSRTSTALTIYNHRPIKPSLSSFETPEVKETMNNANSEVPSRKYHKLFTEKRPILDIKKGLLLDFNNENGKTNHFYTLSGKKVLWTTDSDIQSPDIHKAKVYPKRVCKSLTSRLVEVLHSIQIPINSNEGKHVLNEQNIKELNTVILDELGTKRTMDLYSKQLMKIKDNN